LPIDTTLRVKLLPVSDAKMSISVCYTTATRLALAMGLSHSENSLYAGKPYETRPVNLSAKHTLWT
jgi:hypothetical protein